MYDALGNLAGIRRVHIANDGRGPDVRVNHEDQQMKTSDGSEYNGHRDYRIGARQMGKTSDYRKVTDNRGNQRSKP